MAAPSAIMNGGRFQPPPSSMIATHVINGRGQSNISRDDFSNLLQESLGTDDEGRPNLGKDVLVNLKLIDVITRLGIEPLIAPLSDDPFRARIDQGKSLSELRCCLDVIELAFRQTPEIVFKDVDALANLQTEPSAVYVWLLPILIAIILQSSNVEIHQKCTELLQLCIRGDAGCSIWSTNPVAEYMKDVVSGALHIPTHVLY